MVDSDISSLPTPAHTPADPVEDVGADLHLDEVSAKAETGSAARPPHRHHYERKMGESELAYYLPSRQTGVNDMCGAPPHILLDAPC